MYIHLYHFFIFFLEHAQFSSKVYAPIAHQGRLPVKNQVVDYGIPLISNYQGLAALESTLPTSTLKLKVTQPKKMIPKSAASRKGTVTSTKKRAEDFSFTVHGQIPPSIYTKRRPADYSRSRIR